MKTFLKKNLVWVFALVLGLTTMSFKVMEKNNQTVYWFVVSGGNTVTNTEMAENQTCQNQGPACAIAFNRNTDIPTDLGEAEADDDWVDTAYGTLHTGN